MRATPGLEQRRKSSGGVAVLPGRPKLEHPLLPASSTFTPHTMAAPLVRQLRCLKFTPPVQHHVSRRCISTLYSAKPEPTPLPSKIPQQFLSQLPTRLKKEADGPKKIKIYPPPPSSRAACKDPVAQVTETQLSVLDPKGERKALFDYRRNPRSVKPGDILRVTFKNGDPFNGVCLSIRLRGIDTSFLLRNELMRVPVEMSIKAFSPNVKSVEIVQRSEKKRRRARLFYMRFVGYCFLCIRTLLTLFSFV
jgi:ribosomal protein L19